MSYNNVSLARILTIATVALPLVARSQGLTREAAIGAAISRGGRTMVAAADTSVAAAQILAAKSLENPAFNAAWSKSAPQLHLTVDVPIPMPGVRGARIGAAHSALTAAGLRYRYARALAALDVDTTYTRALAAQARAGLSSRNAAVADSLVRIAIARRNAGDAADIEVELANVNAGQQRSLAISDSLELVSIFADLAALTGLIGTPISLADTLMLPDTSIVNPSRGEPLQIAAGLASVSSAEQSLRAERRSAFFGNPALMGGVETHDPDEPGILPTFGITLPIPFLNRNRAGIATANAELFRARAELSIAQIENAASLAHARRQRALAYRRAELDRALLASANRVAAMSVRAYREGAFPIANVFEAQRSARDVLRQYVDDVADVWIADAVLHVLLLTNR